MGGSEVIKKYIHGTRPRNWIDEVRAKIPQKLDAIKFLLLAQFPGLEFDPKLGEKCFCGNWGC